MAKKVDGEDVAVGVHADLAQPCKSVQGLSGKEVQDPVRCKRKEVRKWIRWRE